MKVAGKPDKKRIYHMLGHRWRITSIKDVYDGIRKIYLVCSPQCCTRPLHSKLEIMESDFMNIPLDKDTNNVE